MSDRPPITIRDLSPADEPEWRRLWAANSAFWGVSLPPEVDDHTWRRLIDPDMTAMRCRVAVSGDGASGNWASDRASLVGIATLVLHAGTWTTKPICYLEDLYVDEAARGRGIGKAMLDDVISLAHTHDWSRLYWHTRRDFDARKLYDRFIEADDYVRYRMFFE